MLQIDKITVSPPPYICVTFKPSGVDVTLTALVAEMRAITSQLGDPEREALGKIMSVRSG